MKNLRDVLNFKEELPKDSFPLTYSRIACEQQKDTTITKVLKDKIYFINTFHGGEKQWDLAIFKHKIVLPNLCKMI
jgi:hypothetical protein